MPVQLQRFHARALLGLGLLALLPACLDTTFTPIPGAFDDAQIDATADTKDVKHDGLDAPDSALPDVTDVPDLPDISDVIDATDIVDVLPDVLNDAPGDADAAPEIDADVPPAGLPLGASCTVASACESSLCIADSANHSVCTQPCTGDCPSGFRCAIAGFGDGKPYCLPLPAGLCTHCTADADCPGGACLSGGAGKPKICGLDCSGKANAGTSCPTGFLCQSTLKGSGAYCAPTLGACDCSDALLGEQWSCEVTGPAGGCIGVQVCQTSGWSPCTAKLPSAEICDGLDNDCNGKIDEKFPTLHQTCGSGVCHGGAWVCSSDAKSMVCSTAQFADTSETCFNGIDDNCDGQTDEGCKIKDTDGDGVPDAKDCGPYDAGVYPAYGNPLNPGAPEACCKQLPPIQNKSETTPVTPATKACDVDCNGVVVGCFATDLDKDGFSGLAGDCNDSDPSIFPGAPDKCGDGIDQDCVGGDAVCNSGNDSDGDGYISFAAGGPDCDDDAPKRHPGAVEVCNGYDDNCDNLVDEGNPDGGAVCDNSAGFCKPGTMVCSHLDKTAVAVTCVDSVPGTTDICNGLDDNCDGKTDEDYPDLGQGCDGPDSDLCKTGIVICGLDALSTVCGPETSTDLQELCGPTGGGDGIDQDCNGATDETCYGNDPDGDGYSAPDDCAPTDSAIHPGAKEACCNPKLSGKIAVAACDMNCDGKTTPCAATDLDLDGHTGSDDCDETKADVYVGAPEKCGDGIDQDCDGTDLSCATIAGQDDDGDGYANNVDCKPANPAIHPGAIETCNAKDDNCNGITDEGNPDTTPGACGADIGLCQPGIQTCVHYGYQAKVECAPKVGPQPDLCNGLDDNCNGLTDEFFPLLGQACDGSDSDQCKNGTWTCAGNGKGVVCNNESVTDLTELCDNIDNNCNGQTDEGVSYFGKKVGATCKGFGACGIGVVECSPELQVAVCSTDAFGSNAQATPEQCNGIDDNCNGQTDEGILYGTIPIGGVCTGAGACAGKAGIVECNQISGLATCSSGYGGSKYAGTPETCNGIDDDCNGHIDEGLSQTDNSCAKKGVCSDAGTVKATCHGGAWQCDYSGVKGYEGAGEISCDGLDNNCDGFTDEPFQLGIPCDGTDSDLCANGVVVCSPDKLDTVCGPETKTNIVELCNGLDDDCDTLTDEDFTVGQACDGPDSDMCATGTWTCTADQKGVECINETITNIPEICDGADDNCNGVTDEGFAIGLPCDGTDSDSCKNGISTCTPDGQDVWCVNETKQNIPEICDGKDNNCDGLTDENFTYLDTKSNAAEALGAACHGIGGCGMGLVMCSPIDFVATCSTNPNSDPNFNGKEWCDGLDNNCDGLTDEGLLYNGIPLGSQCPAVGECTSGVVECGNDKMATCSHNPNGSKPQGTAESCDGKDNDCNGKTDDGLGPQNSQCAHIGVCAGPELVATCNGVNGWTCDYSKIPNFQFTETLCDGLDNDCDGKTDEDANNVVTVGTACDGPDTDLCKTGTWTCKASKAGTECVNETTTNIVEVCDGQDNNCDGQTDEGFLYQATKKVGDICKGYGACGVGIVVCGANLTATCSTNPDGPNSQAKAEICDNVDNNCNGATDEGITYNGLTVGAGCIAPGACGAGMVECKVDHTVTCSSAPDGSQSMASPEDCNGTDDDCDGITDNNLSVDLAPCNQTGVCALAVKVSCSNKKWTCAFSGSGYQTKETLCDSLDNDCNGITDDGYQNLGIACDGPDPDKCPNGQFVCNSAQNAVVCNEPLTGTVKVEVCNNIDDDCNGITDDPWKATLGTACDGADLDKCKNGAIVCAADQQSTMCLETSPNIVEICNGLDDDCNGLTDDGLGLGNACDALPDPDYCKNGTLGCDPAKTGAVMCLNDTYITEKCNGLDDDCDGVIDNGFDQLGYKCKPSGSTCSSGTFQCSANAMKCLGVICAATCIPSGSQTAADTCGP